jgi:SAM-dependent methyltransferase
MALGGRKQRGERGEPGPGGGEPAPPRSAPYLEPYRDAVDRFGPRFEATLWASPEHQRLRFIALTQCFDFTGATVVDAGCGDGALARFLSDQRVRFRRFIGLEAIPEMVAAAGRGAPEGAEFHLRDFLQDEGAFTRFLPAGERPGVVLFSGSLNTFTDNQAMTALERAWAATGSALLFNFLTDCTCERTLRQDTGPARRFGTLKMLEWALTRTTSVVLRHDYLPGHDATVCMRKVK